MELTNLFGQASWTYSCYFNIVNKKGKRLSLEEYRKSDIKFLSMPFGAHSDNHLTYDVTKKCFKFSQHTISTSSIIAFTLNQDTVLINISTKEIYIPDIQLEKGYYELYYWNREEAFECLDSVELFERKICVSKNNFLSHKKPSKGNFRYLEIVGLK